MDLHQMIVSIKKEIPVDWGRRTAYMEALDSLEQTLVLRSDIRSSTKDQLINLMVQFIGVPTLEWQQRIANLIKNATQITITA